MALNFSSVFSNRLLPFSPFDPRIRLRFQTVRSVILNPRTFNGSETITRPSHGSLSSLAGSARDSNDFTPTPGCRN